MKKILIALALALTVAFNAHAQAPSGNTAYVPYANFTNDTLSYLKTNFETNKSFYIGKTVDVLLKDIEIQVLSCVPSFKSTNTVPSFSLYFLKTGDVFSLRENNGKVVKITITFTQPIPSDDVYALLRQIKTAYPNNSLDWTPMERSFYENRIIKDINVYQIDFSQP